MSKQELAAAARDFEAALRRPKRAALQDGPAGRVLAEHWNHLHDVERELQDVIHEYDMAASYRGGPGEKAATAVMQAAKEAIKALNAVSKSGGAFDKLFNAEDAFIKKHGEPDEYTRQQRKEMFPR